MTKIIYSVSKVNEILKKENPSSVCIVTSKKLEKKLSWAIDEIKFHAKHIVTIPDGENAKTWEELEKLLACMSKLCLDRKSIVIALGGGSVGDLVGFAASIYLRGISYIQVPTTLLSQVDSAHGGKTGINFLNLKNQIGAFQLPLVIVVDLRFIESLTKGQIIDGLGEIIKAGFIKDPQILDLIENETVENLGQSPNLRKIIDKAIAVKNYFIEKDHKDLNARQILNVGHTVGHALELKYNISHGLAVIIGMFHEIAWTESKGITKPAVRDRFQKILNHLEIKIDPHMVADWNIILHDKKVFGSKIDFPVITVIGKAKILSMDLNELKSSFLRA